MTGASWSIEHPWLPHLPSARWSVLLIAVAVVASLALGLRTRGARGALVAAVIALDVVALLAIVPVERHLRRAPSPTVVTVAIPTSFSVPGLARQRTTDHEPLPVLAQRHAAPRCPDLRPVREPIRLGLGPDPLRRVVRGGSGQVIPNAYPIRYFDSPSSHRVSHPDAAPPIAVPTGGHPAALAVAAATMRRLLRRAAIPARPARAARTACGGSGSSSATTTARAGATPVRVVLDFVPNAVHAGLYAALEQGFYRKQGSR